jgi:PAS domain S-box-containing protein
MHSSGRLLIVDDEPAQVKLLCHVLEAEGYSAVGFSSATRALASVHEQTFDLVLTDLNMPEMDGISFLRAVFEVDPNVVGIVMTGNGTIDTAVQALQAGALDYILKPFKLRAALPVLARSVAVKRLRVENALFLAERKQAEERLRESERQLRLLADAMPHIVWSARPDGLFDFFNQRWYEFIGESVQEMPGEQIKSILHPDDVDRWSESWRSALASERAFEIECRCWDWKSSKYRWHLGRAIPLRDQSGKVEKWAGTYTDVDDQKQFSEELERRVVQRTAELEQSVREKAALLMEVHHRVRNNLQVICSLLSQQAEASDPAVADALQAAYDRVFSMSLIHNQLYQSETYSKIDFAEYIRVFAARFFEAHSVPQSRVQLQLRVEPVYLTVDLAIPCGLILNELLANAAKHAFRHSGSGVIEISLQHLDPENVQLTVADNGSGLPESIDFAKARSLGFTIIQLLMAQLGAKLAIGKGDGASFALQWRSG